MQNVKFNHDLFEPDNFKYKQINKVSTNKSFFNCLTNAQKLLKNLESSLIKTNEYEDRLLRCKKEHNSCKSSEQRDSEISEPIKKDFPATDKIISPRNQIDILESWSTISVVCLQYQYEELSKRYESLLHAYEQRCEALSTRDETLLRLRKRMNKTQVELAYLHKSLLCVGEKYLKLKYNKMTQKAHFKEKIYKLKQTMCEVIATVERNRVQLSHQLTRCISMEHDTAVALLLAEIKKCNALLLENLYLKSKLEIVAIK